LPWFILICGPNGAGKSTLTGAKAFQDQLRNFPGGPAKLFNPDDFARVHYASNPGKTWTEANLWAATQVPSDVRRCIDAGENVAVETVLSSDKFISIIEHAHRRAYQVGMIYLALESAAVSMSRVARRVAAGGHDVPEDRIRPRWRRSLDNLIKFTPLVDGRLVYQSSSSKGLTLLAEKFEGNVLWYGGKKFPALHLRLGARKSPKPGPRTGGMPSLG
jgi:predicted ABC-type ATPase